MKNRRAQTGGFLLASNKKAGNREIPGFSD